MARAWGVVKSAEAIGADHANTTVSGPTKGTGAAPTALTSITRTVLAQPAIVTFTGSFYSSTGGSTRLTLYLYIDGVVVDDSTRNHEFLEANRHDTVCCVWGVTPAAGSRLFATYWEVAGGTMVGIETRRNMTLLQA
jgi:4-aminobutyrate aminotransferase-like enzyme